MTDDRRRPATRDRAAAAFLQGTASPAPPRSWPPAVRGGSPAPAGRRHASGTAERRAAPRSRRAAPPRRSDRAR